ncbi:hypothetical protein AMTRI_Chr11g95350 [Amborella trichopoda]|uniref:Uricase n=1 Tax=Amborella trichopoda TaxID=13333 RepID=U5D1M4_AMBTC|nr:uricase-2 [Amborella trichopoda]XP_011627134.1 uricase-2 [Amborella trichopoda]XP_020529402.1 uricase-2 [Amborella trichopoda]XP_020529403.1 uricase-2 [Amborella trichopoda]ERN16125.1 hypothetical protein AMTR_s00030p00202080 [Amborella trichopoda]|eukprot:XP_006854658.1 uricase-2 [Amborella trichopoda]
MEDREGLKLEQRHGKARVRVSRVWRRPGGEQFIVEWNVSVNLYSDCPQAYFKGDNSDIVATDSMKNTVYVKAKECQQILSVEDFAIILGNHFTATYPQVTRAIIKIVEKPWERFLVDGEHHKHGFKLGSERHTTEVDVERGGALLVTSGVEGLSVLKTTNSGFEGFIRDEYTLLKDTNERILATEVSALWRYSSVPLRPFTFSERYLAVKKALLETFFGPPNEGVYSPSVQTTLYLMARAILQRFPDVEWVHLKMPNLHFLPVNLGGLVKFNDDVYIPTDEPHGTIEACLSRKHAIPLPSKL